jgi:hypothetical protein
MHQTVGDEAAVWASAGLAAHLTDRGCLSAHECKPSPLRRGSRFHLMLRSQSLEVMGQGGNYGRALHTVYLGTSWLDAESSYTFRLCFSLDAENCVCF